MKLLWFEWKKLLKNHFFLIALPCFFLLNMVLMVLPYQQDLSNKELNQAYATYARTFAGPIQNDTIKTINSYQSALTSGEMTPICTNANGDVAMLDVIKEELYELHHYATQIETQYGLESVSGRQVDVMQGRYLSEFSYHKGWDTLFSYQGSTMFLLILTFIVAISVWNQEKEEEMLPLLYSTKKGNQKLYRSKAVFLFTVICGICLVFSFGELLFYQLFYGLDGAQLPLYFLKAFRYTPISFSVIGCYLLFQCFQVLCLFTVGMIILMLCKLLRNPIFSSMLCLFMLGCFLGLGEIGSVTWNPLGILYLPTMIKTLDVIDVGTMTLFSYEWQLLFMMIVLLVVLFGYEKLCRRKRS